ncbi:unnamed protein product [Darwinula stevensoni]|uniref:Uncharacterized protein n=1 Tax=Darwinula stevensoni TaxID=69355 RepID=A0A7R8X826_9CRUS|nr:unnamed protein product [Darwinula stevensoni]CAG0889703.1 unnamed protein product [Darwinula stevensoni]
MPLPQLIQAIFEDSWTDVELLIGEGYEVNSSDEDGRTPLHAAAFIGNPDVVEHLVQAGARVNAKDDEWITPLHRACSAGKPAMEKLLDHGAEVNARDRMWQTPLHVAAAAGSRDCLEVILGAKNLNINITDRGGHSCLHLAAYFGCYEVIELLLSQGANVNAYDKRERRALHYAAFMGHSTIISQLITAAGDHTARDKLEYTPLHAAAAGGHAEAIKVLVNEGSEVHAVNVFGNSPLHTACLNGHAGACSTLCILGADLELRNKAGLTPLHIAASSTDGEDCVPILINRGANVNAQCLKGRTPLHCSILQGRHQRTQLFLFHPALLRRGSKPGMQDVYGQTPLHLASHSGCPEAVRALLVSHVDLGIPDNCGRTPLHLAAYSGNVECVELLLSWGADASQKDRKGRSALHYAAAARSLESLKALLSSCKNPLEINLPDEDGLTPLLFAAANDSSSTLVQELISRGADASVMTQGGLTPVHFAAISGHLGTLRVLLENNQHWRRSSLSPLLLAVRERQLGAVRLLLQHGVDPNHSHTIFEAILQDNSDMVRLLIHSGAQPHFSTQKYGYSGLHAAARVGSVEILQMLLNSDWGPQPFCVDTRDHLQRTPLMIACLFEHVPCIAMLIGRGADPNASSINGLTPLLITTCLGSEEGSGILLRHAADPTQFGTTRRATPLHMSARLGESSSLTIMMDILKEHPPSPALIPLRDSYGFTPLHWACLKDNPDCLEVLLNYEIERWKAQSADEKWDASPSLLHLAIEGNSPSCAELLLSYSFGGDVNEKVEPEMRTALHLAALKGHTPCVKLLLSHDANVNATDREGKTPLMLAATFGHLASVKLLLEYGAHAWIDDAWKETALHAACRGRHSQVALAILHMGSATPDLINLQRKDGKTALHLAAGEGLIQVTEALLIMGGSVNITDELGYTPPLSCASSPAIAHCLGLMLSLLPLHLHNGCKEDAETRRNALANAQLPRLPIFRSLSGEGGDSGEGDASSHSSDSDFF